MADRTFPIEWRCRKCRHEEWVRVRAKVPGVHNADSENFAETHAQQDAWRSARMKLALRPCPKCGAVDSKTVVQMFALNALVAFVVSVPIVGYEVLQVAKRGHDPPWWLFLLCFAAAIGVPVLRWFTQWRDSQRDILPGLK